MSESEKKDPTTTGSLSSKLFNTAHIEEQIRKDQESRQKFIDELKLAHEQGKDISEYVWPYEWEFRKRPKPHHASNIISLADALDVCGEHFYDSAWSSKDWYARKTEAIERWKPEDNLYRAYNIEDKNKAVDFTNRPEEEKEAFIRKQKIYSKLSSWLNESTIEAFTLDDKGNKGVIPSNIWLSDDALDILDSGKFSIEGSILAQGGSSPSFVYLNREQLEKTLNYKGPLLQRAEKLFKGENKQVEKPEPSKPKPLHTKEKETLLKMIAAMAIDAYGYDPSASRSPIPKEIADIMAERGMPLDPDTVRKWLKKSADLLPQDVEDYDN